MIRRPLSGWVDWIADRLGPWTLCGIERLPGEIRIAHLVRGWKGWLCSSSSAQVSNTFEIHPKEVGWGFHCAVGNVPILFKTALSADEWDKYCTDPPSNIEANPAHSWPFLWRRDKLEVELGDRNPSTVSFSQSLLMGMLDLSKCPERWIAIRFLRECAMVWFLEKDRLAGFVHLDGGTVDPVLLEQEWNQLLESDLRETLTEYRDSPIAVIESTDPDRTSRILSKQMERIIDAPWNRLFESMPPQARFAVAAATGWRSAQVVDENPLGWENQLCKGRQTASKGLLAGVVLGLFGGLGWLGVGAYTTWLRRNIESKISEVTMDSLRVNTFLERQRIEDDNNRRARDFQLGGGRLSVAISAAGKCVEKPSRMVSWQGARGADGFRQNVEFRTAADRNLDSWGECFSRAFVGQPVRLKMSERGSDGIPEESVLARFATGDSP